MEDIKEQRILGDYRQYITKKAVKGSGLFKKDNIILATTATIGEHAILTIDSALSNQQFTNFEIREIFKNRLIPKYVFYYFDIIDEWCKKKNIKSSSFPTVNMDNLKELDFPIPSIETQEKIVKILDEFTKKCYRITK